MSKLNNKRLHVYFNATSYTEQAYKVGIETVALQFKITPSVDYLYLGYKKPQKNFFFEVSSPSTDSPTLVIQIYNGTTWVDCPHIDETKAFKKSNFIYLDEDTLINSKAFTVNSVNAYWVRISMTHAANVSFKGINNMFCCEDDLRQEEPAIATFYPREIDSHIFHIASARDYILRKINNSGHYEYKTLDALNPSGERIFSEDFNQFDLFDIDEIRDAAVFYTLYKVFASNLQDQADDVYGVKATAYLKKFQDSFDLWCGRKLTLDINKDGIEDSAEEAESITTIRLVR